jgi:hypothetical protein
VLVIHALVPDRLDDQRRGRTLLRPDAAGVVDVVVDPRQWAPVRVLVDRVDLPMGRSGPHAPVEGQIRQMPRKAEQVRQVVVGRLFPSGRPDELVAVREPLEMGGAGRGYVVHHAVDRVQAAWRTAFERRVSRREAIPFPEPEQADDPVHVQEEQGFFGFRRILSVLLHKKDVTNEPSGGKFDLGVQSVVENSPHSVKLKGYGSEI